MKALVLLSGGIDSTTALASAIETYGRDNVVALSISYGQKHINELKASERIASYYGIEHINADLSQIFSYSDCALLSRSEAEIPHESYASQLETSDGKPVSTYVPFRNGLFISVAASIALSKGCDVIFYGAHADDAAGSAYPDCSVEFNDAMSKAVYEGSGKQLRVCAPFVGKSKAEIVSIGLRLQVPYNLTVSCYEGGDTACGVCGTCRDRLAAFKANGVKDTIRYKENR